MAPPLVSIGLPVYNGENFLSAALESILCQTFVDFELIISDNGSTDRTEQICRTFSEKDKRIRYFRNDKNLGAAWNFNNTFKLSLGKYFKWAAHDDLCAPNYLLECVSVLDSEPTVLLCHSKVMFIDENGNLFNNQPTNYTRDGIYSRSPVNRFWNLISFEHWCIDIFGLIRRSALKKTDLIGSYVGSDRNLLVELGLKGRFHCVNEYLFFSRQHEERSTKKYQSLKLRARWFDTNKGKTFLPVWRNMFEYFKSINRAKIRPYDYFCCNIFLFRWILWNKKLLLNDIKGVFD
jgi:glycosyltransferase involved in cell wall biosynthesis